MKKLVAIVLLLLAGPLVVLVLNRLDESPVNDMPPTGVPDATLVERGAYLARLGNCAACHTQRGGAPFAGGRALVTPFGTLYGGNLTPDPDTGLGQWSAGQFWRALHNGRSRDGRLLYPAFPYTHYTRVRRADSDALFAYLRSLPPVKQANQPHELRFPYDTQAALAVWRALYFRPAVHEDDPARSKTWNRGAYLVQGLGHCGACHSPRNAFGATPQLMDLSGGLIPMQNWYAPSLASASEAGVADWPLADIEALLVTGVSPRGTVLGPMAEVVQQSTQHLRPDDVNAMAVFLKALPPAPGEAERDPRNVPVPAAGVRDRGAFLYGQHCAACHGDKGEGVRNAYPPLAGNRAVSMRDPHNLVQVVLYGGYPPATPGNPRPYGMPPFALALGDADIAAVLSYIRSSWGNRAAPVSELTVSRQRGTTGQ
jgi:mono/diheme cytochrome c family protein